MAATIPRITNGSEKDLSKCKHSLIFKKEILMELRAELRVAECPSSPPAPNTELRQSSCGSRVAPALETDERPLCDDIMVHKLQHIIFHHGGPWNYDILSNLNLSRIYRYPQAAFY
jgi:hypothetical protein